MTRTMSCKSTVCLLFTLVALPLFELPVAAQYTTANLGGTVADGAARGAHQGARGTIKRVGLRRQHTFIWI